VDFVPFSFTCAACDQPLGDEGWSFCLLCGRVFCVRHLRVRKGIATCFDCVEERHARENSGAVSDGDEERLVSLILRDLSATVGPGLESLAIEEGARVRLFSKTLPEYEQRVVDAVQQRLHDEFVDTTWPGCPTHPNHPLWYSDGWWRCAHSGNAVALLGELTDVRK
jgi:hypothetical protein